MPQTSNVIPNVQLVLQPDFTVSVDGSVTFHFFTDNPGPGENNDWYVKFSGAEFDAITNQNQLDTQLTSRLSLLLRGAAVTAKLGTLPGKVYVVA